MTMATEIKNRVGPPAAAQPGASGGIRPGEGKVSELINCFLQVLKFPILRQLTPNPEVAAVRLDQLMTPLLLHSNFLGVFFYFLQNKQVSGNKLRQLVYKQN